MSSRSESGVEDVLDIETVRPSLVTLTRDVRAMQEELLQGLDSRRSLLEWLQRLTVRTLGSLGDDFYLRFARSMRGEGRETVLLATILDEEARSRDLDEDVARELRERLLARRIDPAFRSSFRYLRADAGEYIDRAGEGDTHDPARQSHIAMRPSLTELDETQREALGRLLDGLDDGSDILDWSKVLLLATHGEVESEFVTRCYIESSTRRLLTSSRPVDEEARELFAATHLLPRFNQGVRDLAGRAGELPSEESRDKKIPQA